MNGRAGARRSGARIRRSEGLDGHPVRRAQPPFVEPMLATLVDPAPLPAGWIYEPKLDGVRVVVVKGPAGLRLYSRNRQRLDETYPEVHLAVDKAVDGIAILDGELVARDPATRQPSFARLQQRLGRERPPAALIAEYPVELWLFDCLHYEGRDLRDQPWEIRRGLLEQVVRTGGLVQRTPVYRGEFEELYRAACAVGAEGLIGKRAASRYRSGRSRDWVKLKCVREQEFVVGGWTDPRGSRPGLGALLLGYWDRDGLRFAGKVGTGFDGDTLRRLRAELDRMPRKDSPFADPEAAGPDVHWVEPRLVVQVGFAEWTGDGRLRHPRFIGVREDRSPRSVRRERPG